MDSRTLEEEDKSGDDEDDEDGLMRIDSVHVEDSDCLLLRSASSSSGNGSSGTAGERGGGRSAKKGSGSPRGSRGKKSSTMGPTEAQNLCKLRDLVRESGILLLAVGQLAPSKNLGTRRAALDLLSRACGARRASLGMRENQNLVASKNVVPLLSSILSSSIDSQDWITASKVVKCIACLVQTNLEGNPPEDMSAKFVSAGIVPSIRDLIVFHRNTKLRVWASLCLRRILFRSVQAASKLLECGGISDLVRLCGSTLEEEIVRQEAGVALSNSLSFEGPAGEEVRDRFRKDEGLRTSLLMIKEGVLDPVRKEAVCDSGLSLLLNSCWASLLSQREAGDLGAIELLLKVITTCKDSNTCQSAVWALSHVMQEVETRVNRERFEAAGGASILVECLRTASSDQLRRNLLSCMVNTMITSASLRSEYVRVGLYDVFCPYFVDTLGKVKKAQNIAAKEGCKPSNKKSLFEYLAWVISSTLFHDPMNPVTLREKGILRELVALLEFPDGNVVRRACNAIQRALASKLPENIAEVCEYGGGPHLRRLADDSYVDASLSRHTLSDLHTAAKGALEVLIEAGASV